MHLRFLTVWICKNLEWFTAPVSWWNETSAVDFQEEDLIKVLWSWPASMSLLKENMLERDTATTMLHVGNKFRYTQLNLSFINQVTSKADWILLNGVRVNKAEYKNTYLLYYLSFKNKANKKKDNSQSGSSWCTALCQPGYRLPSLNFHLPSLLQLGSVSRDWQQKNPGQSIPSFKIYFSAHHYIFMLMSPEENNTIVCLDTFCSLSLCLETTSLFPSPALLLILSPNPRFIFCSFLNEMFWVFYFFLPSCGLCWVSLSRISTHLLSPFLLFCSSFKSSHPSLTFGIITCLNTYTFLKFFPWGMRLGSYG